MIVVHTPSVSHLRRAVGRGSRFVLRNRGGVTDMYEGRGLRNPETPDQRLSRQAWSRSCAAWRELPDEEKATWNTFAARHGGSFSARQSAEPLTGYRVFQSAAGNRQILGLPLPVDAPKQAPPEGLRRVELLPSSEPDMLRLRVEHGLAGGGFRVVVSMSPATLRPSRKPDRRAGRHVCGWGASSTAPLPESGEEIVFTGCRYAVESGQRFGVWIRVVRENDGLGSPEMFLDCIRPEPESIPAAAAAPDNEPVPATGGDGKGNADISGIPSGSIRWVSLPGMASPSAPDPQLLLCDPSGIIYGDRCACFGTVDSGQRSGSGHEVEAIVPGQCAVRSTEFIRKRLKTTATGTPSVEEVSCLWLAAESCSDIVNRANGLSGWKPLPREAFR